MIRCTRMSLSLRLLGLEEAHSWWILLTFLNHAKKRNVYFLSNFWLKFEVRSFTRCVFRFMKMTKMFSLIHDNRLRLRIRQNIKILQTRLTDHRGLANWNTVHVLYLYWMIPPDTLAIVILLYALQSALFTSTPSGKNRCTRLSRKTVSIAILESTEPE